MSDLGAETVELHERGETIWSGGQPAPSLPTGVETVTRTEDSIAVEIVSGKYAFDLETRV